MATNFKKRKPCLASSRNAAIPVGSRVSLNSNQLLVSSGVPSLDNILGGGIPAGSMLLVEEDTHGTFSEILLRYFIAEGVLCSHGTLLVSSSRHNADEILKKLPAPVEEDIDKSVAATEDTSKGESTKGEEELKIAWRYQNLQQKEVPKRSPKFGNYYDLTKSMNKNHFTGIFIEKIVPKEISIATEASLSSRIHPSCKNLIEQIRHFSKDYAINSSNPSKNILRIAVQSFGSPLWPTHTSINDMVASLSWFLLALKTLLRSSFAVCIVTIPVHLFKDSVFTRRLEQCADNVVNLESFAGSMKEKNPAFKDYDGLIHIKKKACINSFVGHDIDTADWAFKLKRKKFCIEKFHLPPDLSETVSRAQTDSKKPQQVEGKKFCSIDSRNTSSSLDF